MFRLWCGVIVVIVFYLYRVCAGGGVSDTIMSACVGLMAGGLPAATVGSVPTVFGWLGCRFGVPRVMSDGVLVPFICACLSRFES